MKRILIFVLCLITVISNAQTAQTAKAIQNAVTPNGVNGIIKQGTIAQLKALSPNSNDKSVTYFCTEEGKEGIFKADFSDNSSIDNTAIVIVCSNNIRLKRQNIEKVNVKWFGAKGNSSYGYLRNQSGAMAGDDDYEAFQNAINYCLLTQKTLYVPNGFYRIKSPLVVSNPTGLKMAGENEAPELSLTEYLNNTSSYYKGSYLIRDFVGNSLITFQGGISTSDANYNMYRGGCMWKSNIQNIGFSDRNNLTNTSSLVVAKRSILMRFIGCVFLGSSTTNFEGFQIDDSRFDDCRFISGGSRIESPNMLLHRNTTLGAESAYVATNTLYITNCIFEGHKGQNLLIAPDSYLRADGTSFVESGTFSALQISTTLFKYPNFTSSSTKNNVELNSVGGGYILGQMSHKGCTDNTTSTSSEIFKIFNSFAFYINVAIEKLPNSNFTLNRFVNIIGGTSITGNISCTDNTAGITGQEAVFISNSGSNNNYITGGVSTIIGTKKLTNRFFQFFPSLDADPPATENGATVFVDSQNRFGWVGSNGFSRKLDGRTNTADRVYTLPDADGKIITETSSNNFTNNQVFQGSFSSSSGIYRHFWHKPTINATANNDFLYGFISEPTYNDNTFTGVKKISLFKLNGGSLQVVGATGTIEFAPTGVEQYFNYGGVNYINATATGGILGLRINSELRFGTLSTIYQKMFSSGNFLIQKGGSFNDVASSILTLNSTNQGFLTPRMTTTDRNQITSPSEGLEIYNLTTHSKEFWNGSTWKTISTN